VEYTWVYHQSVTSATPLLDTSLLTPGLRLAVGLSGGADSVALVRLLAARAADLGLVLHVAHLHHGLRGEEADRDREFAARLAQDLGLVFHSRQIDTAGEAAEHAESIEEAGRRLRYAWFRELMATGLVDAVATGHTLDDQAETVLGKLLRGAWTEGLAGIHPEVTFAEGRILRPLLTARRSQIEDYLAGLGQPWCEDSSNRDLVYTRNRLRHELLPALEGWNPRIREHLTHMAELARDEEDWWQKEVARLAPQLLLTGRPVRGGGRAGAEDGVIALDVVRLGAQPVALQRRLLRHVAGMLGGSLGFDATESLRRLVVGGRAGQRLSLPGPVMAERTPRELRLSRGVAKRGPGKDDAGVVLPVPGETEALGWRFFAQAGAEAGISGSPAIVRNWRAGDRVTLRYSSGPRKVKDVLERLKVTGVDRAQWLVIEWQGRIVWMQGVELQLVAEAVFSAERQ
jgi:tRNA(Ile)-lysidine synthase